MMLVRLILISVDVVCVVIDTGRDRYQDWQGRHQQHYTRSSQSATQPQSASISYFNLTFYHKDSALAFDYAGRIRGSKFRATLKEAKRQLQKFEILFVIILASMRGSAGGKEISVAAQSVSTQYREM